MASKSYRAAMVEIASRYSREVASEYTMDNLYEFAMANKLWEPNYSERQIFVRDMAEALRDEKDEDGDRYFITGNVEQLTMWSHREMATWPMRQSFLDSQKKRVDDDRRAVLRMCEKFNDERRPGEAEFQLGFDW